MWCRLVSVDNSMNNTQKTHKYTNYMHKQMQYHCDEYHVIMYYTIKQFAYMFIDATHL